MNILTLVGLFLLSATKCLMAPGAILAAGYSNFETIIIASLGSIFGCIVFFKFGGWLFEKIDRLFPSKKKKRAFTKKNRIIIKFKNSFGVIGMAILIPIISIPVSALISAKYFRDDKRAIPAYAATSILWAVTLTYFSEPIINWISTLW